MVALRCGNLPRLDWSTDLQEDRLARSLPWRRLVVKKILMYLPTTLG